MNERRDASRTCDERLQRRVARRNREERTHRLPLRLLVEAPTDVRGGARAVLGTRAVERAREPRDERRDATGFGEGRLVG